jgi:hypothetical protein
MQVTQTRQSSLGARRPPCLIDVHLSCLGGCALTIFGLLAGVYGTGELTFVLKVIKHLGKTADGVNEYQAKYMRVLKGRTCRGELECFTQGDLLTYLLDASDQRERLYATAAGKLLERLTRYSYVKTLAFWVDATYEGKGVSKLFQKSGVLLSDLTTGVEDSIDSISALAKTPSRFLLGFEKDFDSANQTLYGTELSDVVSGEEEYQIMLSNVTKSITDHLNERFYSILKEPVLRAACIFEHERWPSLETAKEQLEEHGTDQINLLLKHFSTPFEYLGGDASKVLREWRRLKLHVLKPENELKSLSYLELYERLFDHRSDKKDNQHFYNVLLLVTIVMCFAVDTSVCERGFSLMNNLKTARRSRMGNELLRILMTINTLGSEWKDPAKIPVDKIIEEWRSSSDKGRYEAAMWQAAGLEAAGLEEVWGSCNQSGGSSGGSSGAGITENDCHMADVDAANDNGFFARWGEPAPQHRGELAGTYSRNGVQMP